MPNMSKTIADQDPKDDGRANLQNKNTTSDLGRGSVDKNASYSNSRRLTGKVGNISSQPNIVGEDRKNMPGLNGQ